MSTPKRAAVTFDDRYPAISEWVISHGWIELGQNEDSPSLVRALDEGGLIWESQRAYRTLDEALNALERALRKWMKEQGLE
jgi:hypothetical protein